jgi:hypothetical protein
VNAGFLLVGVAEKPVFHPLLDGWRSFVVNAQYLVSGAASAN